MQSSENVCESLSYAHKEIHEGVEQIKQVNGGSEAKQSDLISVEGQALNSEKVKYRISDTNAATQQSKCATGRTHYYANDAHCNQIMYNNNQPSSNNSEEQVHKLQIQNYSNDDRSDNKNLIGNGPNLEQCRYATRLSRNEGLNHTYHQKKQPCPDSSRDTSDTAGIQRFSSASSAVNEVSTNSINICFSLFCNYSSKSESSHVTFTIIY